MPIVSQRVLSRGKTLELLGELAKFNDNEISSLCLPAQTPPGTEPLLETMFGRDLPREIIDLTGRSKTGSAFFRTPQCNYLIIPPFPIGEKPAENTPVREQLNILIEHDHMIAVVLIRLGSYGIGVCKGDKLLSSKIGTGLVHGRHRKGGSSAHRFERHRDKQIEYFMTRACHRMREQLEPYIRSFDFVVYGGSRTTIGLFKKQCEFTGRINALELSPLLDIPEPRQAVLESAVNRIWSSAVIEWRND